MQDLLLAEVVFRNLGLAFVGSLQIGDALCQITSIGVVHDDAKLTLFRLVDLLEANDVRVVEHFENLGLSERRLLVFFAHLLDVNLFNDGVGLARTKKVSLMAYTETFDSLFQNF